jgi:hypothetical protein
MLSISRKLRRWPGSCWRLGCRRRHTMPRWIPWPGRRCTTVGLQVHRQPPVLAPLYLARQYLCVMLDSTLAAALIGPAALACMRFRCRCRADTDCRGDCCLWHGHQQSKRSLCGAPHAGQVSCLWRHVTCTYCNCIAAHTLHRQPLLTRRCHIRSLENYYQESGRAGTASRLPSSAEILAQ